MKSGVVFFVLGFFVAVLLQRIVHQEVGGRSEDVSSPSEGGNGEATSPAATPNPIGELFVDGQFCDRVRKGETGAPSSPLGFLRNLNMPPEFIWLELECLREDVALEDIPQLMKKAKIYHVAVWNLGTYYDRTLRYSRGTSYDAACFPVVEEFDIETNTETWHVGKAIGAVQDNQNQTVPCDDPQQKCTGNPQVGWSYEYVPLWRKTSGGTITILSSTDKTATDWYKQANSYPDCDNLELLRRLTSQPNQRSKK